MKKNGILRIVGIYFLIGSLWIIFSDSLVAALVHNPALITRIAIYKGLFYITVTAALLYLLIDRHDRKFRRTQEALEQEIRERRRIEDNLRLSQELLSRKTGELLEGDRRKDEFLAMLAHELRNPMSPIRTTVELMRIHHQDREDPEINRWLEIMTRQVNHFTRIVDDLLDTSRISRGLVELKKERVNIADCVEQAVEMNIPLREAENKEIRVSLPKQPIFLKADPARLVQILYNLLNNALKYTPEKGSVDLCVHAENKEAVIEVRDNGIGIPADVLPNVFNLFYQADKSLARTKGGLGLGLTLVKRLTELHGGTVSAASAGKNRGSVFTVRLPLEEP